MVGEGFGKALGAMYLLAIIGIILIITAFGYGGYKVADYFFIPDTTTIESKTFITPEIKLHTDGKTVDTIYVYKQTIK